MSTEKFMQLLLSTIQACNTTHTSFASAQSYSILVDTDFLSLSLSLFFQHPLLTQTFISHHVIFARLAADLVLWLSSRLLVSCTVCPFKHKYQLSHIQTINWYIKTIYIDINVYKFIYIYILIYMYIFSYIYMYILIYMLTCLYFYSYKCIYVRNGMRFIS